MNANTETNYDNFYVSSELHVVNLRNIFNQEDFQKLRFLEVGRAACLYEATSETIWAQHSESLVAKYNMNVTQKKRIERFTDI